MGLSSCESNDLVIPLLFEGIAISRRRVETAVVRVATVTQTRGQVVDEPLVPRHSDFDSLKSILARIPTSLSESAPRAFAHSFRFRSTGQNHCDEVLVRERIEIEHVPVGRFVESAPPVREDGDVTIVPVMEEVMVVERRLFLKEEVHVRRVRITERHTETVHLREQEAVVTRTPVGPRSAPPTEVL